MKYLKVFEKFFENDLVTVNGDRGKIKSVDDEKIYVKIFKSNEVLPFNKKDVSKVKKCMGRCDKKVIDDENGKSVIYCSGCDRITKRL